MMGAMDRTWGYVGSALLWGAIWMAAGAQAQEMDQGEARITARSDVRLSLESGPATPSAKLGEIADVLSMRMTAIRQCYRDVVQQRPTVQGELRVMVALGGGGQVELSRDDIDDEELAACTMAALREGNFAAIRPPGTAYAVLTYSNSAAEGVAETRERRAVEDQVEVTQNEAGHYEARGGNATGEVAFAIEGLGRRQSEAQVAALQRGFRAAIPILLDCRRKAARRSSPAGDIEIILTVSPRGRARVQVRRSTVPDERGGRCLRRNFGRYTFQGEAAGRARVRVTFTGNEAMPVREEEGEL